MSRRAGATCGNYVEALGPQKHIAGARWHSYRHRVVDNLLGTTDLCPAVRRTAKLKGQIGVHIDAEPLTLAVNISAVQFQVATLEEAVTSALMDAGLAPDRLELEITETALMKDRDQTVRVLYALKERGVRVVMDDFGTGYSSLSNPQSFSFDKIKIDRSFIPTMEVDEAARSIIRAIVGIGKPCFARCR